MDEVLFFNLKAQANASFRAKRLEGAIALYTQALELKPNDAVLLSNRAAAHRLCGYLFESLEDSYMSIQADSTYCKGWVRYAEALADFFEWKSAAKAMEKAVSLTVHEDPTILMGRCEQWNMYQNNAKQERRNRDASRDLSGKLIAWKLGRHRQELSKQEMLQQFQQGLAAPSWDPEDWHWKPTIVSNMSSPNINLGQSDRSHASGISSSNDENHMPLSSGGENSQKMPESSSQQPHCSRPDDAMTSLLVRHLNGRSELDHPRRAITALHDDCRMAAYRQALKASLNERPGAHVLVLGQGCSGVLALMAMVAGAGAVTCIVNGKMAYDMSKKVLDGNQHLQNQTHCNIQIAPVPLTQCFVDSHSSGIQFPTTSCTKPQTTKADSNMFDIGSPADIIVVDLFDQNPLVSEALPSLLYAVKQLATSSVVFLPSRLVISAQILQVHIQSVVGCSLSLSALDEMRWRPQATPVSVDLLDDSTLCLSSPFTIADIVLGKDQFPRKEILKVPITSEGTFSAVSIWLEVSFPDGTRLASYIPPLHEENTQLLQPFKTQVASSYQHYLKYVDRCFVQNGDMILLESVFEERAIHLNHLATCTHGACVTNLITEKLKGPSTSESKLKGAHSKIQSTWVLAPPSKLRHSALPAWQYNAVSDEVRVKAYMQSIRNVLQKKSKVSGGQVSILNIGAGPSGLLAMLASRAGVSNVLVQDPSGLVERVIADNGLSQHVIVLGKELKGSAVGTGGPCHLLVCEAFDSGLLGEGALHLISSAFSRGLLKDESDIIPCGARVYCMPVQANKLDAILAADCGSTTVGDTRVDVAMLNAYHQKPEYEAVDLKITSSLSPEAFLLNLTLLQEHLQQHIQQEQKSLKTSEPVKLQGSPAIRWLPLAAPQLAMNFDFRSVMEHHMQPESKDLSFSCVGDGVVNAIVFWHDLVLADSGSQVGMPDMTSDKEILISNSPFKSNRGSTWQQAIQWISPIRVKAGDDLVIHARHDTHAIKFQLMTKEAGSPSMTSLEPRWLAEYEAQLCTAAALSQIAGSDPLKYRDLAQAAIKLSSRPQDFQVDVAQSEKFLAQILND